MGHIIFFDCSIARKDIPCQETCPQSKEETKTVRQHCIPVRKLPLGVLYLRRKCIQYVTQPLTNRSIYVRLKLL